MLQETHKLPLQFLSSFPHPLHLVIEGSTRSGKTWLAQHLSKDIADHTEIWSSFFSETYSVIPNALIFKPNQDLLPNELSHFWRERVRSWMKSGSNKQNCILIDEASGLLTLAPEGFFLEFLHQSENQNVILITQGFETERWLVEHSLKPQFSLIRLGLNAKRHTKYVLRNGMLVQQIEAAKYPCLFHSQVIDLAEFEVDN